MTEPNPQSSTPPTPPQPPAPPAPPGKKPAGKPHRWRRRLIFTAVILLALGMLFRLVMIVVLPPVLRHVAEHYGLNAAYDKMDLYLLDGDVGIWHFVLTPQQGGNSLIQSEYMRCHVSTLDLLRGRLTIHRLEAEGVDMQIERLADGTIPLLQRFISQMSSPSTTPSPISIQPKASRDIDLTSPLRIDTFRLTNVHAHLHDAAVNPPMDANVDVSLRLTDLSSTERPTNLELDVTASPVMDLLHVEGTGTASGKSLDASLHVRMRGIHPRAVAGYLKPLGISPSAHNISVQMDAEIKTSPATQPDAVAANLTLDHISATADGQEAAAVDKLQLDSDTLGFTTAHFSQLSIQGARVQAYRSSKGFFGLAGLELAAAAVAAPVQIAAAQTPENSASAATAPATASSAPTSPPASVPFAPLHWGLGQLNIRDCKASFHDDAVSPPADVSIALDELTVGGISPDAPASVTPIQARLTMPGVIGSIHLDGKTQPFAAPATLDLTLAASDIRPRALQPYLDAIGIESDYTAGTFASILHADVQQNVDGSFLANAKLSDILLRDKTELLGLNSVDISGAGYDPGSNKISVKSIEISGPRLSGRRAAPGVFSVLGLRTKPKSAAPLAPSIPIDVTNAPASDAAAAISPPPTQEPATQSDIVAAIPKIEIDHFAWKNFYLQFDDQAVKPPQTLATGDAGFELDDLNIDLDSSSPPAKPGKFKAWISVPNLADSISADGTISPGANGTSVVLSVDGTGITSEKIAGYFQSARLQPVLRDGTIHLNAQATVSRAGGGLNAQLAVKDAVYKDSSDELLAVDSAQIDGVRLRSNEFDIDRVDVKSPRISAWRDADGSLLAGGFRLRPLPPPAAVPDQLLTASRPRPRPSTAPGVTTAPSIAPSAFVATLCQLSVADASVRWTDHAVQPTAAAHLMADVDLAGVVVGKSAPPATLKISAHEDQALDRLTIAGTITPPPDGPAAKLDIAADGIRAGSLGAYIGPGAELSLRNGQFHTTLDATVSKNPEGGQAGHLEVTNLDYRDAGDRDALLALDSFDVSASRIDLPTGFGPGGLIDIDEISLTGLQAAATRGVDGKIHAMGLTLGVTPPATANLPTTAPTTQAAPPPAATLITSSKPLAISDLAALGRKRYPLLKLDTLELNIQRISFTDQLRPHAAPLALSDFYIWNTSPIELLGDNPKPGQKVEVQIAGRIDPLVQTVNVHALVWPFAEQPGLTVNLNCDGIRGDGLTDLFPELKKNIDGSQLTAGRFGAHLGLRLKRDRKDPLNFDMSKGIGLDVTLKDVQMQDRPNGTVLAALEELHSENIRVRADKTVIIKEVDLTNPAAMVVLDNAGVHVLGWVVKLPEKPQAPKPATRSATRPSTKSSPASLVAIRPTTSPSIVSPPAASSPRRPQSGDLRIAVKPKPGREIRIDKILLSGLDFVFEDRTCRPPLIIPLNSLDLEARDLSSAMQYRDSSCRFEALLGAGKVKPNQRELFSQAEARGVVSLYPKPKGWIKVSLSALDMAALRGAAKQAGVNLGGGTFDSTIDIRLVGDGTIDTHSNFAFTDLLLTEPSNGPIRRALKLDVPLDVAIVALQDSDGSITIPLDVPIRSGQVSSGDIAAAGVVAIAKVFGTAIASAPLKLVNAGLSILGADKSNKTPNAVSLEFDPADPSLSLQDLLRLQELLEKMRDDPTLVLTLRHTLGGGDVSRVSILANPSPEDCLNLAYRLRLKKMELLAARQTASAQVKAELASGYGAEADEAVRHLREIDATIATTEDALDHVYDMLRPGADRQAGRRTRAACLQVAQDRLDAVQEFLLGSQLPGIDHRINIVHPTYSPATGTDGGTIAITLTQKKND